MKQRDLTTLYRVVDAEALNALRKLGYRQFPPCTEAAFYPALNEFFAREAIYTQDIEPRPLYLTRFRIHAGYVRSFEVQTLSGEVHDELWVPSEELENFNRNIVGRIVVLEVGGGS